MAEEAAVAKWGFLRSLFNQDIGERDILNVRNRCYVFSRPIFVQLSYGKY